MKTVADVNLEDEPDAAEIARRHAKRPKVIKDWRKSVGMLKDSKFSQEAFDLGEAWRRSQVEP